VRSSSHIQRLIAVLLVVAVWTLTLVARERCELDEEQQLAAHGRCPGGHSHPATETPKFGVDDEPRTPVDGSPLIASSLPRAMRVVAELEEQVASGSINSRRHSTPRSTRGPPIQG
jgi:hypothetical protein